GCLPGTNPAVDVGRSAQSLPRAVRRLRLSVLSPAAGTDGARECGAPDAAGRGALRLEPEARRLTLRNVAHEESPGKPTVFSESAGWGRLASRLAGLFVGTGLLTALAFRLWQNGLASVDLNFVIAVFLGLGFLLHRDVQSFAQAMSNGGRSVTGVIIQFPLYAGIQAMMSESGLAEAVSSWFAESAIAVAGVTGVSPCQCLPPAIFLSAGAVNLLVPSGGGQWIVQGPMVLRAAYEVGVDHATAVMALSYGDQWTNMIQPFWAIPLLGLTRVPLRLFAGYCFLLMVLVVPLFLVTLAVMSIL
ncbi:MAG: TIGR00366 family protein, partial [Phycisphaerae bacterium]